MKKFTLGTAASLLLVCAAQAETVTVNGHEVYYEVHGDLGGDKTPVLLLHGGMQTIALSFGDFIPEFAGDRPVIGVEQQGHGHTPLNDGPITMETMRIDTIGVLDALSVDKAHVIGFSAGAMLGLDLAVNAPERVRSLTTISGSAFPEGFVPGIIEMQKDPDFVPPPDVLALMPSEDEFAEMFAEIAAVNPGGADTAPVTMKKLTKFITSDWGWTGSQIAAISAPTLVMNGDNDFILAEHALYLSQTIPGAHLAILPNTTHMNILRQPEVIPMIGRFISAIEG
ncbi:pimeloyl-ACP methyl ester carboxylesterase [Labrenzia sp. MBR-25]